MKIKRIILTTTIYLWCGLMVGLTIFNAPDRSKIRVLSEEEVYELEHEERDREEEEEDEILVSEEIIEKKKDALIVACTVYNPVKSQCWRDPLITADGSKISISSLEKGEIRWIAVSRDLLRTHGFKLGDKVILECDEEPGINGTWEIHDTMAERWKKKIDLLQPYGKGLRGTWPKVRIMKA